MMIRAAVTFCLALGGCAMAPPADVPQRRAVATDPLPPVKGFAAVPASSSQQVMRSNADIAADFLELSFRMESGREIPAFGRFESPVRVVFAGQVPGGAVRELDLLLTRLRSEAGIDIDRTAPRPGDGRITVEFVPRARLQGMVPHAACFVVPRVSGWQDFRANRRSARIDWTTLQAREAISIFIPSDVAPQEVRDCLHEELAQALGPLNDLYELSDSVFNDDNFHAVLTSFDMLVLRATYAPELRSGMTRAEVTARLPGILARLNPAGERIAPRPVSRTPRAWITAIETALGPRTASAARRAAAERALSIAVAQGWQDNRRAFSHFALARLSLASELDSAVIHFAEAARIFRTLPDAAVHVAHVDMQMAAFALSSGQYDEAVRMADRATGPVMAAQNGALLATLMMIKSEALAAQGRAAEARAVRLDSLGWARYGFGTDAHVHGRMAEIAALAPAPARSGM